MKEKVLSLAKGNFTYEKPDLIVKPERLTGELEAGTTEKFVIEVTNAKGTSVKGFGSSSVPEVYFLPVFNGIKNELEVEVNAIECSEGTVLQGVLSLVTDCGEMELPYELKVVPPTLRSYSDASIDSYHKLQHLIKSRPEEGLDLFRSPQFKEVFLHRDEKGKIIYDHLVEKNTKLQGAEEFMVAMGKKDVVCFQALHLPSGSADFITYDLNGNDIYDSIKITISTPGSIEIKVSTTVDFIELETQSFHTDEFDKNSDILEYRICMDKVPEGIRHGQIVIESIYQRQVIEVEVHNVILKEDRKATRAIKQAYAMLMRDMMAFREGRVESGSYKKMLAHNKSLVLRMFPEYTTEIAGYLAIMLDNEKEILEFFQKTEGIQPPALDASLAEVEKYLLMEYVKYLYTRREDDCRRLAMLVEGYEDNGFHSTMILAIRLQVDERYQMLSVKVADLKEKIRKGHRSPLVYSSLMQCYEQDHSLLKELEKEDLLVLHYGVQNDLISRELSVNISFLAQTLNGFDEILFSVLTGLYNKYAQIDTLVVICEMLIRNEKRQKKYFPWFEAGVMNHLRITELFEYYMYTMSGDTIEDLPESVIAYFQFENHLSDRCKAKLFTYILRYKEEKPNYYNMYRDAIHKYGLSQLKRHRINRDLGVIYADILMEREWTEALASDLPYVMFTNLLECENDQMEAAVVVHPEMKDEILYQLHNGKAQVQLYTPDAIIMFVDRKGHYHCGTVDYTLETMLPVEDCSEACYAMGSEHYGMLCHMAVMALRKPKLESNQIEVVEKVLADEHLRPHTVGRADVKLYDYYQSVSDNENVLNVLDRFVPKDINSNRLGEFATACIYQGLFEKAEKIINRYGISQLEDKALLMLLQERLSEKEDEFSPQLLKWTEQLYRHGMYEQCVLKYLLSYYMGATETLTEIYLRTKQIPEFTFEDSCRERLLGQVLFAGADPMPYEDLFNGYYDDGKNRVLVKAFLSYYAYEYLMERATLSQNLMAKIEKEALYIKDDVMILALLYHLKDAEELTDKQKEFVEISLEKYAAEARIFAFMKEFKGKVTLPYEIENSSVVEYRSGTTQSVYVHILDEEEKPKVVPMRKIFDGVYSHPMLLFEGEEAKVLIREEETEKETEPFVVKSDLAFEDDAKAGSFFQMMNRVIQEEKAGNVENYKQLQKEYETCRAAADQLFQIL